MRLIIVLMAGLSIILTGCSDDDASENPSETRLKTGFVVLAGTSDDGYFVKYYEELPTGTIDITQGTAFQSFFPVSVSDGAMFMTRTDGSRGFSKIAVNGNGEFVEEGFIPTINDESFSMAIRDRNFGMFHDRNDPNTASIFDPATMQVITTVDLSENGAGFPLRYQKFIFRNQDEVFVVARGEEGETLPSVPLFRVDLQSNALANKLELSFETDELVVFNRFGQRYMDESGNLYFYHGGNLSVPNISGAIVKIPAGSTEYDPEYNFQVPLKVNPTNLGAFLTTFYYHRNDIGYALINAELDSRIAELVTQRGGFQGLSNEDTEQIIAWLFSAPTGAWVKVDLAAQTVTSINGLPALSPFDPSNMAFLNNEPYFAISNPDINAFYSYDAASNNAELVFNVTGAPLVSVFDLSIDE
ncbi:hypothetical protein FNH22_06725 [Fulvivirga sp. M361]|uniref:hypothetical protein n=1 Tax=Fulvivirga sp. M361 TaxID=2594266 RepID=UPI00117A7F3D|nr:hypothetical protein [Fulvivirga sp. M361]TRX60733.1 hypothetical protein FNH22_06725 [Fulvivirga sp. M361]